MRLLVGVPLILAHAFAQGSPPKSATKQIPAQSTYLTRPLPISAETVGPSFRGHDIVSLVTELRRSPLGAAKSEFETTPQYEQRLKSLLESRSRQYVFALDEFTAEASYDADKEVTNVSVTAPFVVGVYDSDNHIVNDPKGDSTYFSSGIELRSILRSTSQYVASNSLGVKVNVTRSTYDEFGVVINKDDTLFLDIGPCCDHAGTRKAVLSLDMDVQTAKLLKPFLSAALVCTLVNPIVYAGTGGTTPTISSPREVKTNQQYLLVRPDELWVYDRRSGHV